jgi:hypothetical protein
MITVIRLETSEEDRKKIRLCMGKRGGSASRKEVQKFATDAYEAALHGSDAQQMVDDDCDEDAEDADTKRRDPEKAAKKIVLKKKGKR